jgi:predicted amidophosphoribosyltransferase
MYTGGEAMDVCPECGQAVTEARVVCRRCGEELPLRVVVVENTDEQDLRIEGKDCEEGSA